MKMMKFLICTAVTLCSATALLAQPKEDDLTVCYIKRLPEIEYVENSKNPEREGWPAEGQEITWRAYVKNFSDKPMRDVDYLFQEEGKNVKSGTIPVIQPGEMVPVDYDTQWSFDRKLLTFFVDPYQKIKEFSKVNNRLAVYTDAITVNFYVEQSLYDYFHQNQWKLGVGTNCWEDWAQILHVKRWNQMLADAIYPETPFGVIDRIRVDSIVIVPDGALPLNGGLVGNNPDRRDKTVDLQWGFGSDGMPPKNNFYANTTDASDRNPFFFEGSLFHELGHARYVVDGYGFDLSNGKNGESVAIMEEGQRIGGTKYMPFIRFDVLHYNDYKGLMGGDYRYIDRYTAAALNLIAGHRAVCGNMNSPCNIGIYQNDLPAQNILTVKDQDGNPMKNASLRIYRPVGVEGAWYGKFYDNEPDMVLKTNGKGEVKLGRCPFGEKVVQDYGVANNLLIIRVEKDGRVGYGFLESTHFNLAYWRGETELGRYQITVNMIPQK